MLSANKWTLFQTTTRFLVFLRRQLVVIFRRQLVVILEDNRDNGKNGRNGLCHEVTYNRDNKITVVNSFFLVNLSTEQNELVNYSRVINFARLKDFNFE